VIEKEMDLGLIIHKSIKPSRQCVEAEKLLVLCEGKMNSKPSQWYNSEVLQMHL